jgi:hypothetical protein
LFLFDRPAHRAAELILPVETPLGRKEIPRVQVRVPQELERAPVQHVVARFRDHVDNAAAVIPVLGVEIVGQNAELGIESRLGTIDVPPFISSLTSPPFTTNPLASSRCPLID